MSKTTMLHNNQTSIGIPVYNEINFLEHTLNSVVIQEVDEIIISDNASTDGSSELCQEFVKKYSHIIYHRFDTLQAANYNFLNCVRLASNDFFMIMGAHDLLSKNYIAELKNILIETDSITAYANPVHLSDEYAYKKNYTYHFSHLLEDENSSTRVLAAIEHLTNCSIYYGLHRRKVFMKALEQSMQTKYTGIDHGILTKLAARGKMKLCPSVTFYRIDPRTEYSQYESWQRVAKSAYRNKLPLEEQIPELIPLGIVSSQFHTAVSTSTNHENQNAYLQKVIQILLYRWAVNEKALYLIVNELQEKCLEYGINLTQMASQIIRKSSESQLERILELKKQIKKS